MDRDGTDNDCTDGRFYVAGEHLGMLAEMRSGSNEDVVGCVFLILLKLIVDKLACHVCRLLQLCIRA